VKKEPRFSYETDEQLSINQNSQVAKFLNFVIQPLKGLIELAFYYSYTNPFDNCYRTIKNKKTMVVTTQPPDYLKNKRKRKKELSTYLQIA